MTLYQRMHTPPNGGFRAMVTSVRALHVVMATGRLCPCGPRHGVTLSQPHDREAVGHQHQRTLLAREGGLVKGGRTRV